jgi:hypothetical protein
MESYEQGIRHRKQTESEIDVLQLLWGGTMKNFTPERRRFNDWLELVGYTETTRCINDTTRAFIRYHGLMFPGQLVRYMNHAVNRTLIRIRKAEESRKEVAN